jgi:hypothetical protein
MKISNFGQDPDDGSYQKGRPIILKWKFKSDWDMKILKWIRKVFKK